MTLGEKLQHLREVEGQLRGLGRPLFMTEVARLMQAELGTALSLPYLSQIERGSRPHLTGRSRDLLARFFSVHPGYLVDDPDGYQEGLSGLTESATVNLAEWLAVRAEELRGDPELYEAFLRLASAPDPRAVLIGVARVLASDWSTEADREPSSTVGVMRDG
jgi:transcriptional regulator with XRE-family HTH domain